MRLIWLWEEWVALLQLEEADDEHEETVRSKTAMPRLIQVIDLQHLLEHKHKRTQYRKLLLKSSYHLSHFDACVLHVILRVVVVDHIAHIYHKILFIHAFVFLFNLNSLLIR